MRSQYELFPDFDPNILDLKLGHIFVLQNMANNEVPQVRYQIMQDVGKYIGEENISTAKFYRILDKLEDYSFVKYNKKDDQKVYKITKEGAEFIEHLPNLVMNVDINVFKYFEPFFDEMTDFTLRGTNNLLFHDFSGFVDLPIIEYLASQVDYFSIISTREKYEWLKQKIDNLRFVEKRNQKLIEPDNSFDTIFAMYPANASSLSIFAEFYRLLDPQGSLFVFESDKVEPNHFVLSILFNLYSPAMYKERDDPKKVIELIESEFNWQIQDRFELKGLLIYKIEK